MKKTGSGVAARRALLLVLSFAGGLARAADGAPVPHDRLQRCPFSAEELGTATGGAKVEMMNALMDMAGAPKPMSAPKDGTLFLSCSASYGQGAGSLLVKQQWFDPKGAAARIQALKVRDLKNAQPVPGDPDGALWSSERNGDRQALHYVRGGNVLVSITVNGVPQGLRAGLRGGLLKLKRVP